jgi:hypothetical protein
MLFKDSIVMPCWRLHPPLPEKLNKQTNNFIIIYYYCPPYNFHAYNITKHTIELNM